MRGVVLAAGLGLALAGPALADPAFEVRHAAARVTVIPEARQDVQITVLKTHPKIPLHISREGDKVIVEGSRGGGVFGWGGYDCHGMGGAQTVSGPGFSRVAYADLPQVVVRTPLQSNVKVDGAVFGVLGRGAGAEFSNAGCGDWTIANQSGPLHIGLAGSGDVKAGSSAAARVSVAGSGDVALARASGGLEARIAGSGNVTAAEVDGPLETHTSGSGDVIVRGGQVGLLKASIAGSGDVKFGGVAQSLQASIAGSGDVSAARVVGQVTQHVAGSGQVNIGR